MADTNLAFSGVVLPDFSARSLTQTLVEIDAGGNFQRDVNGGLMNLSPSQFVKYKTTITCTDREAPAWDGLRKGTVFTVDCVRELFYVTSGGTPQRTVVPGSERIAGSVTFYRPRLTVMCTNFSWGQDEYGDDAAWSIEAEEV